MALGLKTFESLFCYLAAIHSQSYLGSQDCTAINKVFDGFHFVVTNSIKLSQRKKICLIKKLGSTNAYNNYIEESILTCEIKLTLSSIMVCRQVEAATIENAQFCFFFVIS